MKNCEEIKECIACGHTELTPVLNLREQPLANSFKKTREEQEDFFPLAINHCNHCYHVQLTHKVNPDLLFKNYLYVSGTTKTSLEYFDWFADFAIENYGGTPRTVLDIGCNDGSQLDAFKKKSLETTGIDPAKNLHEVSSKKHNVICDYFNQYTFDSNEFFDIITCQNAFAHNFDQLGFLNKVSQIMGAYTKLYITTSQANMIQNNEFDTIYHEHLSFYNIKSMNELCKRAGLSLIDVVKHPIHGLTNIFVISKYQHRPNRIQNLINLEALDGIYEKDTYKEYSRNCNSIIKEFTEKIYSLRKEGYTIIGYGAPAKGNTLMNAALATPDFIIDDNPLKQGMYTPGVSVSVYGQDWLDKYADVDRVCFVPLAWNFFDEIKSKIQAKRPDKNDLFLRYFPFIKVETDTTLMHIQV